MSQYHPGPGTSGPKQLRRSRTDRYLGGVCGGVASYLNMDATLVRILTVVATLFTGAVAAGEVPTLTIDTAALPAGVYVVRATGGQDTAVRTLTVTH